MARVVIYSNQPILAKGLECVVQNDPLFSLAASCATLDALKQHLREGSDLAVLDLTPEITVPVLDQLQSLAPDCKVILWTDSIAPDFALQALTIGVRGVLRKTLPLEAYGQCLHRVHSGDLWFEKRLTDGFRAAKRVALTRREGQLITLLSRGLKNKEISTELGITEGTVKVYLSHLFQKSGVKDRFEMTMHGMKNLQMAGVSMENQMRLSSLTMEPSCRS